jgi:hypothetical protein
VGTVNVDGECLGDIDQGAWVIKNASSSVVGTGACDIKGSSSWVVEGGKIEADRIGTDNGGNHAVWALTLKNGGRLLARQDTWHLKSNPAGSGNGTFTYEGTGNVYELTAVGDDLENSIGLESEIKNVGGTSAVEIKMTANGNYQNIKMPGNVTLLDPYDLEGITLTMKELSSPQVSTIEATGPDYTCYWYGADCGVVLPSNVLNYPCNSGDPCDVLGNPVIFSDSPAVPLWGKIKVEDSGSPSILKRTMADHNQSTPISGDPGDGATTYRDALYAMIITVGKSAIVRNYDDFAACGGSGECSDPVSIYYDDCDIECNAAISGCPASVKCNSTIPSSCECGLLDMCDIPCNPSIPDCPASVKCNTPMPAGCECDAQKARIHREATVTKYGDFDGDKGTVTDADDLAFFNGRFPTSLVQPAPADWPCGGNGEPVCEQYNPLADYNADGLVDCTDWRKFVCYRQGEQTGLGNDLSCSTSSCP